jgi:hypothetical protein
LHLGVIALALASRLLAGPGTDLDDGLQMIIGRASRLDAYWYTRAAVDASRGRATETPTDFDRTPYTAWCRLVWAATGCRESTIALPAIASGALAAGLVVALGLAGGMPRMVAGAAGVFAATSWLAVFHDREPLIYSTTSVALLLVVLVWLIGFRWRPAFGLGWLLLVTVAVTLKETVLLAAPGLAVAQLFTVPGRRAKARLAAALVLAGAAGSAFAWWLLPSFAGPLWHKLAVRLAVDQTPLSFGWIARLGDIGQVLTVFARVPAIAALALVGASAVLLEPRDSGRAWTFRKLLVVWVVLGCALAAGFAYRPTRYLLVLFPPTFLLAAHGFGLLAGITEGRLAVTPVRSRAVLFLAWWLGLAAAWNVLAGQGWLVSGTSLRLGITAALAWLLGDVTAWRLSGRVATAPAPRYAFALAAFVLVSDGRALLAHTANPTQDDTAARASFAAMVGPGARVGGYAAHYLAFGPQFEPVFDFQVNPDAIVANSSRLTHIATLWVPELTYVERLLAREGRPLHVIADLAIGRERYRVYRLHDSGARGYQISAFERARELTDAGLDESAAAAFLTLAAEHPVDPLVLAYAGAAIGRRDPLAGQRLLRDAVKAAPRSPFVHLMLADLVGRNGDRAGAELERELAARLLPHEIVAGSGVPATASP